MGGGYNLEAAPGNGTLAPQNINASETHNAQSPGTIQKIGPIAMNLKIDSWKYIGTDKRPGFGRRQWVTHKLARRHTETVETILVCQWEYVSAYYSLSLPGSNISWVYRVQDVFRGSGWPRRQ